MESRKTRKTAFICTLPAQTREAIREWLKGQGLTEAEAAEAMTNRVCSLEGLTDSGVLEWQSI